MVDLYISIILVSLFFSAFFSGSEIAFISSNKLHLELQGKRGNLPGRILQNFVNHPSRFIGTTLLGNTISLVVYGIFMAKLLEPWILGILPDPVASEGFVMIVQTILATLLVLITAEFLPKSLFMINPSRMLRIIAMPMRLIYLILYPLVMSIVGLSRFIITLVLGLEYEEDKPVYRLTDLNNFIKSLQDANPNPSLEVDTKILDNALEFKTVRVRECMIPRTEIVAIDESSSVDELKSAFDSSGHSKILIYRDSIDDVIGYCHVVELFNKPEAISGMLTPIMIVPETMLANELMVRFISERKSIALVVDEYGGTSGIVSMEDIIEEIFGEIQDEHDEETLTEQRLNKNTWLLSARHEIDYLNETYHWTLPTGDYETLGGLVLSITEDLPEVEFEIKIGDYTIQVISVEDIRIHTVKLTTP